MIKIIVAVVKKNNIQYDNTHYKLRQSIYCILNGLNSIQFSV